MGEGLFQPMHLVVIALIVLLIFGPKRLPKLGKGIGDGIRALKHGLKGPQPDSEIAKGPDDAKKHSNVT